jgi:hypothetical protein
MISGTLIKSKYWICIIIVLAIVNMANAVTATFDDLTLSPETYWNGSDSSGSFNSGGIYFINNFDAAWFSWDGFSYSNITDTATSGYAAQYNVITGIGQGNSANYGICYVGWSSLPAITLNNPGTISGLYVTNNNYAYYSMLNGDSFAKKFGGDSGDDQDWFMLTVTGKNADGLTIGTVDFYLADYRFTDNSEDYIVDSWQYIDLSSLGTVKSIEFALSSSDTGEWGMNTPAYFALDSIEYTPAGVQSGPYTDTGINGYVDPNNDWQHASPQDANAIINPAFRGWATEVVSYQPAPGVDAQWSEPNMALGTVTGSNIDIVSLGDLSGDQISQGTSEGQITLSFNEPIRQVNGYDFVVFENGFISSIDTDDNSSSERIFAELAYVEVSSNGVDFVRFPSVSLTAEPVDSLLGSIEAGNIHNLAGKHPNAYGTCTGTPFDLSEITDYPDVISGLVDVNNIMYVRIVDIPGSGDYYDEAVMHIDPNTLPDWDFFANNHSIYDAWDTTTVPLHPSGGFDLEAVGVLNEQQLSADIDLNGIVDESDLALLKSAWNTHFGEPGWISRCDLAEPKDLFIDNLDLEVLNAQLLQKESWRD